MREKEPGKGIRKCPVEFCANARHRDLERLPLPSTEKLERSSLPDACKVTKSWTDVESMCAQGVGKGSGVDSRSGQ